MENGYVMCLLLRNMMCVYLLKRICSDINEFVNESQWFFLYEESV